MSYGYGVVRPLSDTLKSLGLSVPVSGQERLAESKYKSEKSEKRMLIESARSVVAAPKAAPKTDARITAKPSSSKNKALTILEEIEAIEKSIKAETFVASKPSSKLSEELRGVLSGLSHIKGHSAKIVTKFEWRNTSSAKIVTETFKAICAEADAYVAKINGGDLNEANAARTECDRLAKRFVEAVSHIQGDLSVNKEVFAKLVSHLKDVK